METALRIDITIKDICDGFIYNELEGKGLFGLSGQNEAYKKLHSIQRVDVI